jgi:hypothetical protein
LAARGVRITVGRAFLEAVIWSVSSDACTLRTTAAVDRQLDHNVKKCQQIFNSPIIISTRAIFAIQRAVWREVDRPRKSQDVD